MHFDAVAFAEAAFQLTLVFIFEFLFFEFVAFFYITIKLLSQFERKPIAKLTLILGRILVSVKQNF